MVARLNLPRSSLFHAILIIFSLIFTAQAVSEGQFPTFVEYIQQFNKTYDNAEYHQRQLVYNYNVKYIQESNCSSMGVNMFTDWSVQEMKKLKGAFESNIPSEGSTESISIKSSGLKLSNVTTPNSYDWRQYNAVTPIKNQGNCGSCWSYSTTAFFQSDLIINNNFTNEIDLSEQFLLKCDNRSLKCNGGFLFWAMQRVIDVYGGMPTEKQYPYNSSNLWLENGMCYQTDLIEIDKSRKLVSFYDVEDVTFIEKLILKKPVNINLCSKDLQFYAPKSDSRTLFCSSNQSTRDHTVLLVGYTETEWIIKNQWSTTWGVDGYGYISKQATNDCCIGKQLFTTGTISSKCEVDNCEVCVQQSSCFKCQEGFYVKNYNGVHTCQICSRSNCVKCVNFYGVCDICAEGYSVTYPSYACAKSTVEHCAFMYNEECAECHEGYTLDGDGNCTSQSNFCYAKNCKLCKDGQLTLCSSCAEGYSLNSATFQCEPTIKCSVANCSRCAIDDQNTCEVCSQANYEFSQSQQKCIPICKISGCSSCQIQQNNSTLCVKCKSGHMLSVDKKSCEQCSIKHCGSCSSPQKCESCLVGFYFNSSAVKCEQCQSIQNCIACGVNSSNSLQCNKCASGYTLGSDGQTCMKCMSGCPFCQETSLYVCSTGCGLLNYQSQAGTCQSCQPTCLECQDNNFCLKCFDGFTLDKGVCYKSCIDVYKCDQCQYTPQGSICTKCKIGYKMVNNVCVVDSGYNCLEQNGQNPNNCQTCPQKYFMKIVLQRKICAKCNVTDPNCISCLSSSPSVCSKCVDSYYVTLNDSTCSKCSDFDSNCVQCQGLNQCTSCKDGFYILSATENDESSGTCEACSQGCVTCRFNSEYCLSCKDGYQLSVTRQCLKSLGVRFTIVIDAEYDSFLNELLTQIYGILANLCGLDSEKYIELTSLIKGSIEINGKLHMPESQTDQNAFLEKVRKSLEGQTSLASRSIMSVNTELITASNAPKLTEIGQMSKTTIIGVAVGGGVFAVIMVVLVIIGVKKFIFNKEEKEKRMAKKKAKAERKEKRVKSKSTKSAISTEPSSHGKSQKPKDDTDKYINDQVSDGKDPNGLSVSI